MKAHTEYLTFNIRKRKEIVHITDQIEAIVRRSGIRDGLALVFLRPSTSTLNPSSNGKSKITRRCSHD